MLYPWPLSSRRSKWLIRFKSETRYGLGKHVSPDILKTAPLYLEVRMSILPLFLDADRSKELLRRRGALRGFPPIHQVDISPPLLPTTGHSGNEEGLPGRHRHCRLLVAVPGFYWHIRMPADPRVLGQDGGREVHPESTTMVYQRGWKHFDGHRGVSVASTRH